MAEGAPSGSTRAPAAPRRGRTSREELAEDIAARLDLPFTIAGFLFVLILIADRSTPAGSPLALWWTIASWCLWALFVFEFVLRLVIAPSTSTFLRHNWWQLVFLALPFLRFLRGLSRSARLARALSTSVRGSRTAGRKLTGRMGLLVSATLAVIIGAGELLFEFGPAASYPAVLHDVALAAISGEPLPQAGAVADWLEIGLALYSTVFFAALAGSLGAFFLERHHFGG